MTHPSRECRSRSCNNRFSTGCLQVERLIVSAPGDLRLSANFSVFVSSFKPVPG
jgi:hypothetical protein